MPDRIIRDQARRSPTLQALSDAAERAWWRLTIAVDDQGRFEADPALLLAELFKRRPVGWTVAKMARVITEWAENAGPLIHLYQVSDSARVYGHVVRFLTHQRRRDSRPRHPDPPCGGLPQFAAKCGESRQLASVSGSDSESREARAEGRRASGTARHPAATEAPGSAPGLSRDQGGDGSDGAGEAHRQCPVCRHQYLGGPRCPRTDQHRARPSQPPPPTPARAADVLAAILPTGGPV